ncbi:MAG: Helix-turn-helix domain [Pseudomonadota bacterium]|jgi:transcriptional regulator with XRE-family HTH domain
MAAASRHAIARALGRARAQIARLAALRQALDIGRTELADALGTTRQTIYRWEHGQAVPSALDLWAWAAALGVTLGDIDGVTDPVTLVAEGAP